MNLLKITEKQSMFGKSYSSIYATDRQFFKIHVGVNVGEIEIGNIDEDSLELFSMYINGDERGKGYGKEAFLKMLDYFKKDVILMADKDSLKFWKKMGFKKYEGSYLIYKRK